MKLKLVIVLLLTISIKCSFGQVNDFIPLSEDDSDMSSDEDYNEETTPNDVVNVVSDTEIYSVESVDNVETFKDQMNANVDRSAKRGNYYYDDGYFGQLDSSDGYNWEDANNRIQPYNQVTHRLEGGGGYIITPQRLAQIRANFLYWFHDQSYDDNGRGDYITDIHASMPQVHKNFNFQLPFFGFRFNYTRVSMHGFLEFSDPPDRYTYPLVFPIKDWPRSNDPSFIGIFFSKCRIGRIRPSDSDQRAPGVYFRMERDLMTRTDRLGVEMRERIKWDIREGVVGADTFDPKHVIVITWKNMSFAGGIDNSLYRTNTFQMVVATDEVYTYAIFNYVDITWSSHTEAGGDTFNGEGGVPAFIGFNAGNGTQSYEYKPYSQSSALRDLTGHGWANGFPGRHMFRLDERIMF